jgi:hypothetical protein
MSMKVKDAIQYGKISTGNSKMPGTTFAIDAFACITFPDNLNPRVSAAKLDGDKPKGINGSQVYTKGQAPKGYACPARTQGNNCGECRACWNRDVPLVSYPKH